ncbi:MAG TPA: hypothetical protein VD930_04975 [Gemmatimonadales bacterium]|nr:hypothetical protein [Gemmatimonadales bacterium]
MLEQTRIHGLRVRLENTRPDIESQRVLDRLTRALDLIAAHAPHRLRRMQHDLAGIVVRRFACRGAFFPQERECLVELTFTVNPRHGLAEIAASIIHEATHARIQAMCGSLRPHQRPREERLCRKAELEFGLLVPDGQIVVERARAALAMGDHDVAPAVDWAEAARRVHASDQGALGA